MAEIENKYLTLIRQTIAEVETERDELVRAMATIDTEHEARGAMGPPTVRKEYRDAKAQLGRVEADLAACKEREAELVALNKRVAAVGGLSTSPEQYRMTNSGGSGRPGVSEVRGQALDLVERLELLPEDARAKVTAALEGEAGSRQDTAELDAAARYVIAAGSDEYLRAFQKLCADPFTAAVRMTPEEADSVRQVEHERRAMAIGANTTGGYGLPLVLDPAVLLTNSGSNDPMRSIARVISIAGDKWKGISSAGSTASWDDEAEEVSDDSPTPLGQPEVDTHRLTAFIPFSIEAGMDIVNFAAEMQLVLMDSFDQAEATAFWTGSGTGEPYGAVTVIDATTTSEVSNTTAGTFAMVDVYNLHEALPARFRRNGRWAGNIHTLNLIRRMGESITGNAAFWSDLGPGTPPTLLGSPVHEASPMTSFTGQTTGAAVLMYADFTRYVIADRLGGSAVELVPHLFGASNQRPTGQRGFFAWKRSGANVTTAAAFRVLNAVN